jgi:hypothetical protein
MPLPGSAPGTYLVFAAASNMSGVLFGTVALETSDFTTFTYPTGFTNPVIVSPNPVLTCNLPPADNTGFDETIRRPDRSYKTRLAHLDISS